METMFSYTMLSVLTIYLVFRYLGHMFNVILITVHNT
jgi:hypothetical protein